ncbi:hypothetical protein [Cytophaga hutchinsonii]|uniref:Transmembrane protein n=1 Tax=Cytophaga hutchinsonii (strain ATCC 33406 / DSM 1761 / CIP 103989 / NBRC 15051 / NCIMB 9469 / D465) TaxID=269798 RepID=A0A6N4SP00_CYTH3|nr:hypothetical protein [Cytophaga hutchinsonii]ABG58009.1 hypothetical protein CHU_0722 [Cytophaga hutchinsonii ATCC 33406]SFX11328.1 hypothetical protein SAMN04487930_101562 [Cytophaga hutchinsonii ATCC 33406]
MKKEINYAVVGLIIVSIIIQMFGLGNFYVYRTMLGLYSLTCLYLLWAFYAEGKKKSGSGVLNSFSLIFTGTLIAIQVMSVTVDLSGVEYVLLSVAFTGISLSLLFMNDLLKD